MFWILATPLWPCDLGNFLDEKEAKILITRIRTTEKIISEMDFFSNLLPEVPSELPAVPNLLDPTSPYQNLTVIQSMFSAAFLGTFIANLAAQTVRHILG